MKKICLKIPGISEQEHFTWSFAKNLVKVVKRNKESFFSISVYLYNKNIVVTEANSGIRYTEDHSIIH